MKGVQPDSKAGRLLVAMRESNRAIWTRRECAEHMGCDGFNVPNYLKAALAHGQVHADKSGGQFSLQPFTATFTEGTSEPIGSAPSDQVNGYVPPKMVAPRPGSDVPAPARAPGPPPAPVAEEPAPALADASTPEAAGAEAEEVAPAPEFNACVWADGEVTIYGAQENEDGSFTLSFDQAKTLRKLIAWLPA